MGKSVTAFITRCSNNDAVVFSWKKTKGIQKVGEDVTKSLKSITTSELIILMNNVWSTVNDIQKIGCVGKNRAYKIRDEIRRQMLDDGQFIPRYVVSTEYVIKYFNLNEKKLRKTIAMEGE